MKARYNKITALLVGGLLLVGAGVFTTSCTGFLDRKPRSQVSPEDYFTQEGHLAAATMKYYDMLPTHGEGWSVGRGRADDHTDNQITTEGSRYRFFPGQAKVPSTGGLPQGSVRAINSDIALIEAKLKAGEVNGNQNNINHYLGELHFFRALIYFDRLQEYGDYPIITEVLPDQQEVLVEHAKRKPRNEVARFIVKELDTATEMLRASGWNKQRITKPVAQLLKSRVALYEASWLTYFKDTPFVPGGPEWPGAKMEYNKGFSIDLQAEINYFLDEAMKAAKIVADAHPLVENSGKPWPNRGQVAGFNPYVEMFSDVNQGTYSEVLLWRQYSNEYSINHTVSLNVKNGGNTGLTKGFVDAFLMADGLPIYKATNYAGDETLANVKKDRDGRLQLFLMAPGDMLNPMLKSENESDDPADLSKPSVVANAAFAMPGILNMKETRDVTGYKSKKYFNYDPAHSPVGGGKVSTTGSIVFRAAEAYLNYMEACYMKNNSLDDTAKNYWKALRRRAKVDEDFQKTIDNTDMNKEALGDWGAYSAGELVDATLYNIRRERRCEFVSEGMRWRDLTRWRALDQVKNYIVEGFNLWGGDNHTKYPKLDAEGNPTGESNLVEAGKESPNVSAKSDSDYLRPYRIIQANNDLYNGYTWTMALYLSPVSYRELQLNAPDGKAENSYFYQNPYWPYEADGAAIK